VGDGGIGVAATPTPKRHRRSARPSNRRSTRKHSPVSQCANWIEPASLRTRRSVEAIPAEP
jgi:hypothetical protein